jgi:DNA polymerase III subunit delta'
MASETADKRVQQPLAPWLQAQLLPLLQRPGHALLLQGPQGQGQYELALALVQAWLCESPLQDGTACGHCNSCHAVHVRTQADLCVLMPETLMLEHAWPLPEKAQKEIDEKKRKPSKEIRVDALRDMIAYAQTTASRGKGKAVLVYPAERMNAISANALLKTLEEPVGDVRFVLASEAVHQLLPTIRSRCQSHVMASPDLQAAQAWLCDQGVPSGDAQVLLKASGVHPKTALQWHLAGVSGAVLAQFPRNMAQGQAGPVADWPAERLVSLLLALCHDMMLRASAAPPRFFALQDLPKDQPSLQRLRQWHGLLIRQMRTIEHPYQSGLLQEALLTQAKVHLQAA